MEHYIVRIGDITYLSELILDIFDVKDSMRTDRATIQRRTAYFVPKFRDFSKLCAY